MESNKTFKIPGLVGGKKDQNMAKLNEAEIQAVRDQYAQHIQTQFDNQAGLAIANSDSMTTTGTVNIDDLRRMYGDQVEINQVPHTGGSTVGWATQDHHQTSPALIDPNIWGQSPLSFYQPYDNKWDSLKKTRIPQRPIGPFDDSSKRDFDDSLEQFKKYIYKDKKSAFEELIDELFSTAEKEQFLIDVGYEFESPKDVLSTFPMDPTIRRKMTDGTYKIIKESVDSLFLKEITVKFKNLLLARSILKLKLNVQDQIKAQENSSSGE